ncbi:MAG: sugar ABC transporter ATP-binding protein [Spirochaetales bacterium]|nr:sugar ABC transporter ATP-binding protein [Spirochaetales bacterium]
MSEPRTEPLLRMRGIGKSFPGVRALKGVHFELDRGEVHALVGENGAGKSTLMKILCGVYRPDEGAIVLCGDEVRYASPREAQGDGIAIIHQELNLVSDMTVAENIFLGREPLRHRLHIDRAALFRDTRRILDRLGVSISPAERVRNLSVAQQQMVEIAKALTLDARVIVMDEPTDALTDTESEHLFSVIAALRVEGAGIVYISHRLPEIFRLCDRVTVLRDVEFISTRPVAELTERDVIKDMVGRSIGEQYPYRPADPGDEVLRVEGASNAFVHDVNFVLRAGEVVGVAGLMGAGRTELAKSIFGRTPFTNGTVSVTGRPRKIGHPKEAIKHGIFYVSEDRKGEGLVLGMSVTHNITLSSLGAFVGSVFRLLHRRESEEAQKFIDKLAIRTPHREQPVRLLSGGNQQKVSIAQGLMSEPAVLILDEPTRGIDVGAKREIYRHILDLKRGGVAILLISSDLPEVLGLSDRLLVMAGGTIVEHFEREVMNAEAVMAAAVAHNGDNHDGR